MAIAGSLIVTVSAKTTDFEAGMRKVRIEVQTTQKAVTQAESSFSSLGTTLLGLTAGVASVTALSAAMGEVVRVGTEMANLRASFVAISGGAQAGNREFQFVVQTANKLGLELKSVAEQYRSLSAATRGTALEGTATRALFTTLSTAAQTFGLSTEQLGRALTAMQQIVSKGKVSMEELRGQLGEALPGAMQIAARAFNTTTKGLEDMIAKGVDATEFVTRFTAQLKVETPAATARAGQGIQQLGNEIYLLKDRIAQSGVLSFLDEVSRKLAEILAASRTAAERARADVLRMLGPAAKHATPGELAAMTESMQERSGEDFVTRDVAKIKERAQIQERFAARQKEINEQQLSNQAILRDQTNANKALTTTLESQKTAIDNLNKSSAATPEIYGRINGTLKEQITFLEKRKAITEKSLETLTESIVARSARTGAVPPELASQKDALQRQLRDDVAAIAAKTKAIQDAAAAERKAIQDTEAAKRKAKQLAEETARQDLQQAEEVARVHTQNIEALRTLASRYTAVRAERDADRASTLAASLAYSQHADEAKRLAQNIAEVQRIEEQLPALRSEAQGSATRLENIRERMKSFEPRRRGESLEEELTRSYTELAQAPGVTMGTLTEASVKMQEALDTEQWERWQDVATSALDHVGDAITQFAFQGKLTFKEMVSAIAEDFFRLSLQTVMGSATQKGGWLEMGLDLGLKALGIAGGFAGGGTSGTLPTTWGAYNTMSAAGAFSGRQHGGPVMPGKYYTVGERGPELFTPGTSGTIIPHGQVGATVVNVHVSGVQDAQSFVQSRGAVSRAMMSALSQARQQM